MQRRAGQTLAAAATLALPAFLILLSGCSSDSASSRSRTPVPHQEEANSAGTIRDTTTTTGQPAPRGKTLAGSIVTVPTSWKSKTYDFETDIFKSDNNPTCESRSGEVRDGTGVLVYNESGTIIASGRVTKHDWTELHSSTFTGVASADVPGGVEVSGMCRFDFSVANVPRARFYSVEVGRTGKVTYTVQDLDRVRWNVSLTEGG